MGVTTEVCFLIGEGDVVLWADRSMDPVALPDSRARWEAIWEARDHLRSIVHSHPGGPLAFSSTDRSTMDAIDAGLAEPQHYAVVTPGGMLRSFAGETTVVHDEPWWVDLLRAASGMRADPTTEGRS